MARREGPLAPGRPEPADELVATGLLESIGKGGVLFEIDWDSVRDVKVYASTDHRGLVDGGVVEFVCTVKDDGLIRKLVWDVELPQGDQPARIQNLSGNFTDLPPEQSEPLLAKVSKARATTLAEEQGRGRLDARSEGDSQAKTTTTTSGRRPAGSGSSGAGGNVPTAPSYFAPVVSETPGLPSRGAASLRPSAASDIVRVV